MKNFEEKNTKTERGRKLAASMSKDEMRALFDNVPVFAPQENGRERIFTMENTFHLFLWQVLSMSSCAAAVQKLLLRLSIASRKKASPSSSAYCQARGRMPQVALQRILGVITTALESKVCEEHQWQGRSVKIVDGTTVSMPDTPENQSKYPQSSGQKPGCGFPIMRILAVFSLATGALLSYARGSLHDAENVLLSKISDVFCKGDILLADRGFCSYALIAGMREAGVDILIRMREKMIKNYMVVKKLGKNDFLIEWKRPATLRNKLGLPDCLLLRRVKYTVKAKGFRTKEITVLTTLTDRDIYTAESFAELYLRRWRAEINLKDLKTTLGMDVLKCLTPEMIDKELCMHFIAYNMIRDIMFQASDTYSTPLRAVSFKYTMTIMRQWAPSLTECKGRRKRQRLMKDMLFYIAMFNVPERPFRREPRAVKRRPKPYQLMTSPRHVFMEIQHIKKYRKSRLT